MLKKLIKRTTKAAKRNPSKIVRMANHAANGAAIARNLTAPRKESQQGR